jgi:hypothetical protein
MITHVVLMKFKPENKDANMQEARSRLRGMFGQIPGLRALEVGLHGEPSERALDLALITRFDDFDGLRVYADHPVHVEVKRFLASVLEGSYVVDFENTHP